MKNILHTIDKSIAKAKVATNLIDPKHKSIALPPTLSPLRNTPGDVVQALLLKHQYPSTHADVSKQIMLIRRSVKASIDEAYTIMADAEKQLDAWQDVVTALRGGTRVPSTLPMSDDVSIVIDSAQCGALDASEVAGLVKFIAAAITDASAYLAEQKDVLSRVASASQCALANAAARVYLERSRHDGYSEKDRQLFMRTAKHYLHAAKQRKATHQARFFNAIEKSKTFDEIEFKHSGVRVNG